MLGWEEHSQEWLVGAGHKHVEKTLPLNKPGYREQSPH